MVIPGRRAAVSPESMFQRPVFMDSGPRPSGDPGMIFSALSQPITPLRMRTTKRVSPRVRVRMKQDHDARKRDGGSAQIGRRSHRVKRVFKNAARNVRDVAGQRDTEHMTPSIPSLASGDAIQPRRVNGTEAFQPRSVSETP